MRQEQEANKACPKHKVPLLNRRDAFFLLNTFLDPINSIGWFDINFDFFTSESLDLDHGPTPKPQNQVKSGLFLNVVVS